MPSVSLGGIPEVKGANNVDPWHVAEKSRGFSPRYMWKVTLCFAPQLYPLMHGAQIDVPCTLATGTPGISTVCSLYNTPPLCYSTRLYGSVRPAPSWSPTLSTAPAEAAADTLRGGGTRRLPRCQACPLPLDKEDDGTSDPVKAGEKG